MVGGELPHRREVVRRRHHHPAFAHDGFEKDCSGLRSDRGGHRIDVAVRHVPHTGRHRLERCAFGGLAGQCERAHRASVERLLGRYDLWPPGAPGDLERRLVGLGAGIAEERPTLDTPPRQQRFGQLDHRFVEIDVRGVSESGHLLGHRRDDAGVGMPQDVHRDPTEKVEILATLHIGENRAEPGLQGHLRRPVVLHQRSRPPFLQGLGPIVCHLFSPLGVGCV